MTRTGWYSLAAARAFAAAAASCSGGRPSAAADQEVQDLEAQVQVLQDSLDIFKDKVKKYFKHVGPEVESPRSFYQYVDSLAMLVCDIRSRQTPKAPGYGICIDPQRLEKVPPPTYPPR